MSIKGRSIKQMAGYMLLYDSEWENEFQHIGDNKIVCILRGKLASKQNIKGNSTKSGIIAKKRNMIGIWLLVVADMN